MLLKKSLTLTYFLFTKLKLGLSNLIGMLAKKNC